MGVRACGARERELRRSVDGHSDARKGRLGGHGDATRKRETKWRASTRHRFGSTRYGSGSRALPSCRNGWLSPKADSTSVPDDLSSQPYEAPGWNSSAFVKQDEHN